MGLAVRHTHANVRHEDWGLLMNDDTTVMDDFVQCLLETALAPAPAAVDRSIGDEADNAYLLSICASVDAWRLFTCDILETHKPQAVAAVVKVDALSGCRVLFPMAGLVGAGGLPPSALPDYLAGYEASVRVRNAGWRLMLLQPVAAYSDENEVSMYSAPSWRDELFHVRSP